MTGSNSSCIGGLSLWNRGRTWIVWVALRTRKMMNGEMNNTRVNMQMVMVCNVPASWRSSSTEPLWKYNQIERRLFQERAITTWASLCFSQGRFLIRIRLVPLRTTGATYGITGFRHAICLDAVAASRCTETCNRSTSWQFRYQVLFEGCYRPLASYNIHYEDNC